MFAMVLMVTAPSVAQQLTMSIKDDVREDVEDLDARVYFSKRDLNDEVCALLKVTPTNPLKSPLTLEVGGLGVVDRQERENGEIWFYLPAQVKNLKFTCMGYTTPPTIPVKLKPGSVYRLTIHTDAVFQTVQNAVLSAAFLKIILNTEGAVVSLGRTEECEMVSKVLKGSVFAERLNYDTYYYKIEHSLYETVTGKIVVEAGLEDQHINLTPAFGYLNITSSPSGAELFIDGKSVGTTPWNSDERFGRGDVELRFVAENYYPLREKVAVVGRGAVEKHHFDLRPQFGTVECVCDDAEAEIWIDEEFKGKGRWTGSVGSLSQHVVEARRAGHLSQSVTLQVVEGESRVCRVGAPVALYGMLEVQTTPELCNIKVDGEAMGTTPTILSLLVGKHKVELSANGFAPESFDVEIAHNQTITFTRVLNVKSEQTSPEAPYAKFFEAKIYKVGDLYDDGFKKGVVFEVSDDGKSGKIVSIEERSLNWDRAKEWCASRGDGWYLPTTEELKTLYKAEKSVNDTLKANGLSQLSGYYWSSVEKGYRYAWYVIMYDGDTSYASKYFNRYVRAVSAF